MNKTIITLLITCCFLNLKTVSLSEHGPGNLPYPCSMRIVCSISDDDEACGLDGYSISFLLIQILHSCPFSWAAEWSWLPGRDAERLLRRAGSRFEICRAAELYHIELPICVFRACVHPLLVGGSAIGGYRSTGLFFCSVNVPIFRVLVLRRHSFTMSIIKTEIWIRRQTFCGLRSIDAVRRTVIGSSESQFPDVGFYLLAGDFLALGAKFVWVGRLWVWGLSIFVTS